MKKKVSAMLVALAALLPLGLQAQEAEGVLLTQSSGLLVGYAFSVQPRITFSTTDLVMEAQGVTVSYPLSGLKLTFGQLPTAISDMQQADVQFHITSTEVTAMGLKAGAPLNLYTTGGILVGRTKAAADGTAFLSLQGMKQGVYIINSGKTTYKISKQ